MGQGGAGHSECTSPPFSREIECAASSTTDDTMATSAPSLVLSKKLMELEQLLRSLSEQQEVHLSGGLGGVASPARLRVGGAGEVL